MKRWGMAIVGVVAVLSALQPAGAATLVPFGDDVPGAVATEDPCARFNADPDLAAPNLVAGAAGGFPGRSRFVPAYRLRGAPHPLRGHPINPTRIPPGLEARLWGIDDLPRLLPGALRDACATARVAEFGRALLASGRAGGGSGFGGGFPGGGGGGGATGVGSVAPVGPGLTEPPGESPPAAIPVPPALPLLAGGLGLLWALRRRGRGPAR